MNWLDHKIPPPIVAMLLGALMWSVAQVSAPIQIESMLRIAIVLVLVASGMAVGLSGAMAFRRSRTTTNPMKPGAASSLVVVGVYRYTRNPMYLGVAVVLIGWAAYLATPLALLGPIVFILFITRFQIIPEELALTKKFGQQFLAYKKDVRRWL